MDIVILLVGALLGAILSLWLQYYFPRPVLVVTGTGSSATSGGFRTCQIRVENKPALLGVKIPSTTILGKRLYNDKAFGLIVPRYKASECTARLVDNLTGQTVAMLIWRQSDGTIVQSVNLESGESADLMIFASEYNHEQNYFAYQLDNLAVDTPKVPPVTARIHGTREFSIVIVYSYGMQTLTVPIKMTADFGGGLSYRTHIGGGSF